MPLWYSQCPWKICLKNNLEALHLLLWLTALHCNNEWEAVPENLISWHYWNWAFCCRLQGHFSPAGIMDALYHRGYISRASVSQSRRAEAPSGEVSVRCNGSYTLLHLSASRSLQEKKPTGSLSKKGQDPSKQIPTRIKKWGHVVPPTSHGCCQLWPFLT